MVENKKSKKKMTKKEFEQKTQAIMENGFEGLDSNEVILKSWLENTRAKHGTQEVQRMVSNFKDTKM